MWWWRICMASHRALPCRLASCRLKNPLPHTASTSDLLGYLTSTLYLRTLPFEVSCPSPNHWHGFFFSFINIIIIIIIIRTCPSATTRYPRYTFYISSLSMPCIDLRVKRPTPFLFQDHQSAPTSIKRRRRKRRKACCVRGVKKERLQLFLLSKQLPPSSIFLPGVFGLPIQKPPRRGVGNGFPDKPDREQGSVHCRVGALGSCKNNQNILKAMMHAIAHLVSP